MMRRLALASALFVAVGSAAPLTAVAGTDTDNLSISSSVSNNCIISTTALNFNAYDPIVANKDVYLDGTGTVSTTCTTDADATITLSQGQNPANGSTNELPLRQLASDPDRLAYFLYKNEERTTVWGNTALTGVSITGTGTAQDSTVYARITAGQNVPAGAYADTVTATVTF